MINLGSGLEKEGFHGKVVLPDSTKPLQAAEIV
jgi:hypothetical protein